MSGVVKGIGKAFKSVVKGVGTVVKGIVNVVKDHWPIILAAAAAFFTVGAAMKLFAPAVATAASTGAATTGGAAATGTAYSNAAAVAGAAAPSAAAGGAAAGAAGAGAATGGGTLMATPGLTSAASSALSIPASTAAGPAVTAGAGGAGGGGLVSSVLSGMTKYWPVTMVGGQLLAGVGQGMMAKKTAEEERELRDRELEEERRQFDVGRTFAGSFYGTGAEGGPSEIDFAGPQVPGLVASAIQSPTAAAAPAVAAPQAMTPQTLDRLVAMQDQGLIPRSA